MQRTPTKEQEEKDGKEEEKEENDKNESIQFQILKAIQNMQNNIKK